MVPIRNLAQNTPLLYACGFSLPLSTARPPHYSRIPESQKNPVMTTIIMLTSFLLFPIVWAAAYQLFHRYLTVCCCTAHLYAAGCAYLLTYLDTLPASRKSGFPWPALQNAKFWEKIAGYFPCSIHLAEPLDSTQKYIFAAFPHGACSLNHIITMTNACGMLSQHYTGQRRDLAATVLHWIPLFKDFLLALGCVDASAATAKHNLNKGRSILIYIGGEKEQLMTSPGQQRIYLKHRKGFIKLALQYGADLVPMYCFGENETFTTSSALADFRHWLQKNFSIGLTIFWGRYGFLPHKVPLRMEVGHVIKVTPKAAGDITDADVDALHEIFLKGMVDLFEKTKVKYEEYKDAVLEIH